MRETIVTRYEKLLKTARGYAEEHERNEKAPASTFGIMVGHFYDYLPEIASLQEQVEKLTREKTEILKRCQRAEKERRHANTVFEDERAENERLRAKLREGGEPAGLLREALAALDEIDRKDRPGFGRPALGEVARKAIRSIKPRAALLSAHPAEQTDARSGVRALQEFAKWAIREGAFQAADLDGVSIQEKAQELGLIEQTTYDPSKHGPSDCAEAGDEWFVFSPTLSHPTEQTDARSGVSALDGNRPLPIDRETLGRMVREAWVRWAHTQPNPKPSWLLPYDDLSEPDKEADRQIGEAIARWTLIHDAARLSALSPAAPEGREAGAPTFGAGAPAKACSSEKTQPNGNTERAVTEAAIFFADVPHHYKLGDRVTKLKGSSWTGRVVGFYSTSLTPVGYAVESENEPGSVQIYPEAALAAALAQEGK